MRRFALSLALALLFAACTTPATAPPARSPASVPGVSLAAERSGDAVRLTLANRSNGPVGYNLCTSTLLRRGDDGGWAPVQTDLVCTMEIRSLSPGESASFAYPVSGISSGEYSWRTNVEMEGARREVISNPVTLP